MICKTAEHWSKRKTSWVKKAEGSSERAATIPKKDDEAKEENHESKEPGIGVKPGKKEDAAVTCSGCLKVLPRATIELHKLRCSLRSLETTVQQDTGARQKKSHQEGEAKKQKKNKKEVLPRGLECACLYRCFRFVESFFR